MAEPLRANIARGYLFRLAMVAFFGGGLGFWCIYDGLVTYPAQRERALAYRQLLDAALQTETKRAKNAASELVVPTPPLQWPKKQWVKQVQRELVGQEDAVTSEQSRIFLRLIFLYQHLEPGQASKLSEEERSIDRPRWSLPSQGSCSPAGSGRRRRSSCQSGYVVPGAGRVRR